MLLVLSHGQASVESGFSVNEATLQTNMRERSLVAQRSVFDFVKKAGGAKNCELNDDLLKSIRTANDRWKAELKLNKAAEKVAQDAAARKRKSDEVILHDLEVKKRALEEAAKRARADMAEINAEIARKKAEIFG